MRAVAVVSVLCALLVSGCGKTSDPQTAPSFATSADASPAASADPAASPQQSQGNNGPTYPGNAKDYTKALLVAWGKDKNRVDQLTTEGAALQIAGAGAPNNEWNTFVSCVADTPGYTKCIYHNVHGDVAMVRLQNSQIGRGSAVTEALLEKTTYPAKADDYAEEFWAAWDEGNTDRMRRLSSSNSVVTFFNGKEKPTGTMVYMTDAGSFVNVQVNGLPAGSFSFTLKVQKSLLGKPSAIVGASN